jgi:hypothetical protein
MSEFCKKLNVSLPTTLATNCFGELPALMSYRAPQKHGIKHWKKEKFFPVGNDTYYVEKEDVKLPSLLLPRKLLDLEYPFSAVLKIDPTAVAWGTLKVLNNAYSKLIDTDPGSSDKTSYKYMLPPHVDKVRKCCINFYLSAHGEKTKFFKYFDDEIVEVENFVAEAGDSWLLDVSKPHAVELVPPNKRIIFSMSFVKTPYEEVVKFFD